MLVRFACLNPVGVNIELDDLLFAPQGAHWHQRRVCHPFVEAGLHRLRHHDLFDPAGGWICGMVLVKECRAWPVSVAGCEADNCSTAADAGKEAARTPQRPDGGSASASFGATLRSRNPALEAIRSVG